MSADTALERARQHFLEGVDHFEAGRLEEALACFEASLALAPGRPSVLRNLGTTLFRLKRWQDAIPSLRQATAADPVQTDAWFALGLCHQALAQWKDAAGALEAGLARDPLRAELWLACGQCHANAGQAEAALRAFQRVLDIDTKAQAAWSARGSLLRDLGRMDEAAASFERALALGADPELHDYYLAAVRGAGTPAAPPRAYVETLFDQYSADFETHLLDKLQYRGHEWLLRPLLAAGRRYPTVLDLGCGTGLCGPLIAPLADAIHGVDLSQAMLAQAGRRGVYRELIHADLASFLARDDLRADLVLAADVFIYVGALDDVFAAVRRILEPGGCFAFTAELAADGDDYRLLPSLRYAHSEAYLRRLADVHGFRVRELQRAPLRKNEQEPLDALYVYLE
jgi:predicted TPR repeat methyltransferase